MATENTLTFIGVFHRSSKIQDIDSLIAASNELLKFNGPNLAKDTDIFIKTCEVTRYLLSQEEDKSKVFLFQELYFPSNAVNRREFHCHRQSF